MLLLTKSGIFWCPVTLVPFSSNLSNFERKPKKQEKKIQTNFKKFLKPNKKIPSPTKFEKKCNNPKEKKRRKKILKNPKNLKIVKNAKESENREQISKKLKKSLFSKNLNIFFAGKNTILLVFQY